jgi:phage shock protein PspC (stress-responsive transcriptional regulator)
MKWIQKIAFFFEMRSYGVCSWIARKSGISSSKVRVGFIYASFITLGSPLLIYFAMAWILEYKHFFGFKRLKRPTVWEL